MQASRAKTKDAVTPKAKPKRAAPRRGTAATIAAKTDSGSANAQKQGTVTVAGYDSEVRFYATRYKQGDRTVFALDLSLDQVASLIPEPDPDRPTEGNRAIRPAHAAGFGQYIREQEHWVSPAMLLRAPAVFDFDPQVEVAGTEFGIISFPRLSIMDLHILDGQHRILGIHIALRGIANDMDRARSSLAAARRIDPEGKAVREFQAQIERLNKQRERLGRERISVQIFVEDDSAAFKQMFFDIADNALGITASVRTRFDSRKVVNRALPLASDHPLLLGRVDPEGDRIGRGSPYLMGAKHVAEIIRTINVGLDGRVSRRQETEFKEATFSDKTKTFLDTITEAFPPLTAVVLGQLTPDALRKTSLLGSVLFVRTLAGAYQELMDEHAFSQEDVETFFAKLSPHVSGPAYVGSVWVDQLPEIFGDGSFAPRSRRQDLKALKNAIRDWAIDKPKWLDKAPAPRPVAPTEEDLDPLFDAGSKPNALELLKEHE